MKVSDVLSELRTSGNCAGVGHEIFFPVDERDHELVGAALSYCSGCPVQGLCYKHAMEHEEFGVWGGTTARQRRSIKRKAKAKSKSEYKTSRDDPGRKMTTALEQMPMPDQPRKV